MIRAVLLLTLALFSTAAPIASAQVSTVPPTRTPEGSALLDRLNAHATVAGTDSAKSYTLLFDAYLEMGPPPQPISDTFDLITIWPEMSGWSAVADWAESNPGMAEAIMKARDRKFIGLPYGEEYVSRKYRDAGVMVSFGPAGRARIEFPYLDALNVICAYTTAEVYRRMEAGQIQEGLDLTMAYLVVLRQFCDRDFLEEKTSCMWLLAQSLGNLRDAFLRYQSKITPEQFTKIAWWELPYLRPDRSRLFMPEADRIVSEALLDFVFDADSGNPNPDRFANIFAQVQSVDQPLTQFGAARRWKMISEVHGSLDASRERLNLIYDDWWRRWRIAEYDPLLEIESQFERTNEIRYAAVVESIDDLQNLFPLRNQLMAEVFGTAVAAGLSAYRNTYGNYPRKSEMMYAHFVRKICDFDPFDKNFDAYRYRLLGERSSIDTPDGRIWLEGGECILYSVGQNHVDEGAREHTDDGYDYDFVIWPPIKSVQRQSGLID